MRLMVGRGGIGVFACQVCVFVCFEAAQWDCVFPLMCNSHPNLIKVCCCCCVLLPSPPPLFLPPSLIHSPLSLSLSFSFTRLPFCCCFCSCCCCCRCWDTHHYTALLEKARGSHSLLQYIFFLELCPLSLSPHLFHTLSQMKMSAEEETLSNG